MIKGILYTVSISLGSLAYAQDSFKTPFDEPASKTSSSSASVSTSPNNDGLSDAFDYSLGKRKFAVQMGTGRQNYSLDSASGGLNISMGSMAFFNYGFTYLKPKGADRTLYGYSYSKSSKTSPNIPNSTTVFYSPATFNSAVSRYYWETQSFLNLNNSGWKKNLYYAFGLELNHRWADISYPYYLMTNRTLMAFRFAVGHEAQITKNFFSEFKAGWLMPFFFREHQQQTGAFNFSLTPEIEYLIIYNVSDLIDFALGANYSVEQNFFNGAGSRGGLNAKETYNQLYIPLEIRFKM